MKKSRKIISLIVVMIMALSLMPQMVMAAETDNDAYLYGWYRSGVATANDNVKAYVVTNTAVSGANSLYVQHNDSSQTWSYYGVAQDVEIPAGNYTLSFWVSGEYDGRMCTILTGDGNWQTHKFDSSEPAGNPYITTVGANGWTKFEKTVTITNPNTYIRIVSDGNTAGYYIDDISLVKEGTTVNLLVNGGFEEVPVDSQPGDAPEFEKYETIILGSTDFQHPNGSADGAQVVEDIIDAMEEDGLLGADAFFCCGDYANTYGETEENLNVLKSAVSDFVPDEDSHIYVQGNHDAEIGTQGLTQSGNNDPESGEYGVFVINEDDYMWYNNDLTRIKNTAANLASYLNEKLTEGYDKPIFVLSHLPLYKSLRTTNDGDAMHANQLFYVLNQAGEQGLNIIFMSGHDHSSGYESYLGGSAVYLAKGDSINIPQGNKNAFRAETLNFTYMNAGYIGYYAESSGRDSTLNMSLFCIDEDTDTVDVYRYDRNGLHYLKSAGVLRSAEVTAGEYEANTTVYTSPQSISLTDVNHEYDIGVLEPEDPTIPSTPEAGNDAYLYGWYRNVAETLVGNENVKSFVTTDAAVSGANSLYIENGAAEWSGAFSVDQAITIPAGTYTLSFWVKGEYNQWTATILSEGEDWQTHKFSNNEYPDDATEFTYTDGENGWKKLEKTLTVTGTNINIRIVSDGGENGFYIDDISLVNNATSEELITNGSFDETEASGPVQADDAYLYGWYRSSVATESDNAKSYVVTSFAASGDNSLYVQHNDSSQTWSYYGVAQDVEIPAGEYTLSFWLSGDYDGSMCTILTGDDSWQTHKFDSSEPADNPYTTTAGENGWTKFEKTVTITNPNIYIRIVSDGNTPGFYIDDISLVNSSGDELITNGSFEEKAAGEEPEEPEEPEGPVQADEAYLYGWYRNIAESLTGNENAKSFVATNVAVSGTNSLYIENGAAEWSGALSVDQDITIPVGTYTLSFWVKGEFNQWTATIVSEGDDWQTHKFANTEYPDDATEFTYTDGENGWKKLEKTLTVTGANKNIRIVSDGGQSGLYIDDIRLVKEGRTENIIKNGSFEELDPSRPDYEVKEVVLKKAGQIKENLDGAGNYSMSFFVKNNLIEEGMNVVQFVAVYDEDGVLYGNVHSTTQTINAGDPFTEIITPFVLPEGQFTVEFFVFDGRDTLNIIGEPNPHTVFGYTDGNEE